MSEKKLKTEIGKAEMQWTEREVWNVIADTGVRGLHAKVNEAIAAAYKKGMEDAGCNAERDPGRAA
jgi:D-tyrosyl-tRNA(Tyr) deacylase